MSDVLTALLGALVGAGITAGATLLGPRLESERRRREAARAACADFSAALMRMRYLSERLAVAAPDGRGMLAAQIEETHEEARTAFERLRLLSHSSETQRAGRYALRHIWAIWKQAETGEDPRGAEYPDTPHRRFNQEIRNLYVAVRRETGVKHPGEVFPEPID